jgi:hypothetical protein
MLLDAPPANASLHAVDVRAFLGAQSIADSVDQGDVVEYWKSAPYLFNFMDDYALKKAFKSTSEKHELRGNKFLKLRTFSQVGHHANSTNTPLTLDQYG